MSSLRTIVGEVAPRTCGGLAMAFLLAVVCGCPTAPDVPADPISTRSSPQSPAVDSPLQLFVIDDPDLAEVIPREWRARSGGEFVVHQAASSDLAALRRTMQEADVVIYPSRLLGTFAEERQIVPLPKFILNNDDWAHREIFDLIRLREIVWGQQASAVSFGSPQLVLYYRADLLSHLNREPPTSWSELQDLLPRMGRVDELGGLGPADGSPWYAAVQPLGPRWAGQMLLARAAAYARHRGFYSTLFDYRTMKPLITLPPFVRALEELVDSASIGPPQAIQMTPSDARQMFLQGQCGFAFAWPAGAEQQQVSVERGVSMAIGYAELPGSDEVFNARGQQWESRHEDEDRRVPLLGIAGRLGSVTRQSRHKRQAFNLLAWLTGPQWGGQVAAQSRATTLYRQSQRSTPERWADRQADAEAARQYVDLVARTQSRKLCLVTLRIPGECEYLAALDTAVHRAVTGEQTPHQALSAASDTWQQITDRLGLDRQRAAYQRSLGLNIP